MAFSFRKPKLVGGTQGPAASAPAPAPVVSSTPDIKSIHDSAILSMDSVAKLHDQMLEALNVAVAAGDAWSTHVDAYDKTSRTLVAKHEELRKHIDTSGDGVIQDEEMKAALNNPKIVHEMMELASLKTSHGTNLKLGFDSYQQKWQAFLSLALQAGAAAVSDSKIAGQYKKAANANVGLARQLQKSSRPEPVVALGATQTPAVA